MPKPKKSKKSSKPAPEYLDLAPEFDDIWTACHQYLTRYHSDDPTVFTQHFTFLLSLFLHSTPQERAQARLRADIRNNRDN